MEWNTLYPVKTLGEIKKQNSVVGFCETLNKTLTLDDLRLKENDISDDWNIVFFESDYYGSHPENGEGDEAYIYAVRPRTHMKLLNQLVGKEFSHGHFSFSEAEQAFEDEMVEDGENVVLLWNYINQSGEISDW